jgi:nicotinamide riboside transporter PnuC
VLFWLSGNYASAVLYVVYEVFCILGIYSWYRRSK